MSVSIVKSYIRYFFQFIMKQNVYQISCIWQHTWVKNNEFLRFQSISAKHFNVKNQMVSVFATVFNAYCIIHCNIQMICLINSQKLITVLVCNCEYCRRSTYKSILFSFKRQRHKKISWLLKLLS